MLAEHVEKNGLQGKLKYGTSNSQAFDWDTR